MDEHKFEKNKKYYTVCIYGIVSLIISVILLKAIWNWASTVESFHKVMGMLSPFLIGLFIAYLMNPLVKFLDKKIFTKLFRIKKKSISKILSILFSYLIVIGIMAFCISIIIPEIYSSLKNLSMGVQDSYDKFINFLEDLSVKYPDVDFTYITTVVKENSSNIINFVKGSLDTILPMLYNTSVSVISWAFKIIIAIMVSCYMLIDKNRLLLNCKKFIYAFIKKSKADYFIKTCGECNKIFGNFIIGKTIDSTIIGFMCFILMSILNLKYAMLISVIVGVTNMIPYIGPFIGAVPGILILLTFSWKHALIFSFLILALQQFDGLYLGPKILGNSTGLRPVWIIFAITVGGWLAGVIGMFLGVPVVAVIAYLFDRYINKVLDKKNISIESLTPVEEEKK